MIADVNPEFEDYSQHDSNELLAALFEGLNNELNKNKKVPRSRALKFTNESLKEQMDATWNKSMKEESSFITDLFKGQLVNIMFCLSWKKYLYDFDNFECLSLEIPSKSKEKVVNLIDWFYETMKKNYFPTDMGFKCSKWGLVSSIYKEQKICRLPKILAIHLKRFEFSQWGDKKKKKDSVEIPLTITELDKLFYDPEAQFDFKKEYSLFAISRHYGSISSGHYVADVNNISFKGDKFRDKFTWYSWSDDYVSEIKKPVLNGDTPYVLFYYQRDIMQEPIPNKLDE